MFVRNLAAAALALLLVGAVWWLLSDYASDPGLRPIPPAAEPLPEPAEPAAEGVVGDYPPDYVDDLPLTDAPPIPETAVGEYQPTFEMPDLIGDGMLVPLEIDLGEPLLPETAAEAP